MITEILNRLEVLAGLEDNKVEVEEARGLSEENFKALSPTKQIKYIKEHPHSKYGRDPKWLKRAKMLKTRMLNMKKAKLAKGTENKSDIKSKKPTVTPKKQKIRALTRNEIEKVVDFKRNGFDFEDETWTKAFDIIKDAEDHDLDEENIGKVKKFFKNLNNDDVKANDALMLGLLSEGKFNIAYALGDTDMENSDKVNNVWRKIFYSGMKKKAAAARRNTDENETNYYDIRPDQTKKKGRAAGFNAHERLIEKLKYM